ncbi:alpha/beta hydrolase [Erythrobacter litoralis]|uniref:alpha/beta hydrolase n=1 Tax=Erythrobacter litoralis TaxID=39960 RepID=UPI002434A975|nr:alpha/beta hydrolase [Erythrobacter litoralis]MDG6077682.1 alpha/beta hydrolase [Erythrobacter litoralis]
MPSQTFDAQSQPDPIDRRAIPADARESLWRASDGHEIRRIDWPGRHASPRGSILFLPGRGDFYEKYLETLEDWHRAGWRVTAADWRGQGGSGRLGGHPHTGHVEDFADWVADLQVLWSVWTSGTPGPHVLLGHSMGGHLVMRALTEGAASPDAAVLVAPMLGMAGPPLPLPILHAVAKLMTRIGDPRRQAWKWSEKPGEDLAGRQDLLTHDINRYQDELWWRIHRPEVLMGPASWRWVERAYASTRILEAEGALERVTIPVLMISTANDKLVRHDAVLRAVQRLPNGELLEFDKDAHHELLREVDSVRHGAMEGIAHFLDLHAPAER